MLITWGTYGQVAVDATITETHLTSATVTEHPVEKGQAVTDHVRPGPDRISLDCIVTNTPISQPASNTNGAQYLQNQTTTLTRGAYSYQASLAVVNSPMDRVKGIYDDLTALQAAGTPISITTGLKNYDNMVIVSISAPRSAQYGGRKGQGNSVELNAINFSMDCQRIRVVTVSTVDAPASIKKTKRGSKGTKKADDKSKPNNTLALNVYNKLAPSMGLPTY